MSNATKPKQRGRIRITDALRIHVVQSIENWPLDGSLTGNALSRKISCYLRSNIGPEAKITRQGLFGNDLILAAFKKRLSEQESGKPPKADAPEKVFRDQRIERLEKTIKEQKTEIDNYKEMFARYRYNAKRLNIDPAQLEVALPPILSGDGERPKQGRKRMGGGS